MPKCNHAHGQPHTGDRLTTFNKYGELFLSLASNTYWFADMFDIAIGLEGEYGASAYGYGFGLFIALLTAPGASYCHNIINIQHEKPSEHITHDQNREHAHEHSNSISPSTIREYTALPEEKNENFLDEKKMNYLTCKDKTMLVGDAVTHAGDAAGTITAIVNAVTKNALPRWGKGVLQCGATLFGAVYAAADVRSCKNAIIDHHKKNKEHEDSHLSAARIV